MPRGAFYTFPNVTAFGRTADWLADYLLDEAGVAVLPGTAFGPGGEGYLRLCFANSMKNIKAGLARIDSATGLWQPSAAQMLGLYDIGGVYNPLQLGWYRYYTDGLRYRGSRTTKPVWRLPISASCW